VKDSGISNRESPMEEDRERKEHPPQEESNERQDTGAGESNAPMDQQGKDSSNPRPAPSAGKVDGAFGKERQP
jgi:hypothetical protein